MEYIINDLVMFDEQRSRLSLLEGQEEVFLSQAMARLLVLFIERNGQTLERDELFEKVWDDFGMRSSNANLNQHISLLRKEFALLGLPDNIIITVPKIGFKFLADITEVKGEVIRESRSLLEWSVPVILLLSVCCSLYTLKVILADTQPPTKSEYLLGKVDRCNVFSYNRVEPGSIAAHLDVVRSMLHKHNLTCSEDKEIRLNIEQHFSSKGAHRIFFSLCLKENSANCNNIYIHHGEV